MIPNNSQLLEACKAGDEQAWQTLVERYQRLVYTVPRRAGLDEDQAAEVFQEVFTTFYQKVHEIEQPDRLHAWFVTTARRKTWRLIQKSKNLVSLQSDDEDDDGIDFEQIPDSAILPQEEMEKMQEQHRVRTAVEALDEKCRELIKMLFYESDSTSYTEIAQRLGRPEGSIGPTRARCLKKLLQLLA
jgi:RNA polymerase sigma factor (sigma-70 family)